ncbi:hypothetical protein BMS3Abin05_01175 [bacterium BMS3Abin05]|nr:hypothetical protein BMS3Abin05_01175 [bacterium BMS3Abin05]
MKPNDSRKPSYKKCVRAIQMFFRENLNLRKDESFLIITDEFAWDLSRRLWQIAIEKYPYTYVMAYSSHESRPKKADRLLAFIRNADVTLFVAREFPFLWEDFCISNDSKTRWAGLIGIEADQFIKLIDGDNKALEHDTQKLRDVLTLGKRLTIQVDSDHSLSFEIQHPTCTADTGIVQKYGEMSFPPGGRVLVRAVEGSAAGDLLINGSLTAVGIPRSPVRFLIKGGRLVKIYSKEDIEAFRALLRTKKRNRRTLVRVGIGLNPRGRMTGNTFIDERANGLVHLTFGDSADYRSHILNPTLPAATLKKATVKIDNKVILKRGKLVV